MRAATARFRMSVPGRSRCSCARRWPSSPRWPRRRTRPMCRMGCSSPRNWRGARSGSPRSSARGLPSRHARKSAMCATRPSMMPRWQRARPRLPRQDCQDKTAKTRLPRQDCQDKTAKTGKKPGGFPPAPPVESPDATDQINLTDEDSRIMPVPGGGFEQCYNVQAAVAAGSLLVVAGDVVQAPNDKQQIEPMLAALGGFPEVLGDSETLLADTGYFSEGNVKACAAAGSDPRIAQGRQMHYPPLEERSAADPPAPDRPTPVQAMGHRLKTTAGKALYALRKQTPEPVFGIIKSVMGFRQFSMRGLEKVRGEWKLVTMSWNIKRMFALAGAV